MLVSRRTAVKQILVFSGGAFFLSSCLQDKAKSSGTYKNLPLDADQEALMGELAATLIPTTDTPGAREVSAHLFALKMLDDCYSGEQQQKFMKGMAAFGEFARRKQGSSFVNATKEHREAVLADLEARKSSRTGTTAIDNKPADPDELAFFYEETKKQVIKAYLQSQYFLTRVEVYELIPSRFHGCVPLKKNSKTAS